MCDETIALQASGRTDAGVHARGQVANFHTACDMPTEQMMAYINEYLPEDIAVVEVTEASPRFHSRLNAVKKCYTYRLINSSIPDVFLRRYAWVMAEPLDLVAMKAAAGFLCGEHDFKSFTSAKKGKKSTIRCIDSIEIEKHGDLISMTFTGNGFLHHMVRILVGTLVEVGLGKRTPGSMVPLLEAMDREQAGMLVPAKGLTLERVDYQ